MNPCDTRYTVYSKCSGSIRYKNVVFYLRKILTLAVGLQCKATRRASCEKSRLINLIKFWIHILQFWLFSQNSELTSIFFRIASLYLPKVRFFLWILNYVSEILGLHLVVLTFFLVSLSSHLTIWTFSLWHLSLFLFWGTPNERIHLYHEMHISFNKCFGSFHFLETFIMSFFVLFRAWHFSHSLLLHVKKSCINILLNISICVPQNKQICSDFKFLVELLL